MLRLIGILIGSALAVAFLIIALGPPRLSSPVGAVEEVVEETATATAAVMAPVGPEPLHEELAAPIEEPLNESPDIPLTDAETEALIEEIFSPRPQPGPSAAPPVESPVVDENWYAFWSPFRSEIAASGFIAKLQETTGIDYRVVKVKTGVYEVAFAYVDDADIQDKLARISDATGLDMTGG